MGSYNYTRLRFVLILIAVLSLFFSSCEKEESPLAPLPKEAAQTVFIDIKENYSQQVYFDFSQGKATAQNNILDWELGFATQGDDYHIILNQGSLMQAADMGNVAFESVNKHDGAPFKHDHPEHKKDSLGLTGWFKLNGKAPVSNKRVYIINLGVNEAGDDRGYKKMMISDVSAKEYILRVANLNGSGDQMVKISRDGTYDYTYVSIANQIKEVKIAPSIGNWDIQFTRYIHFFYQSTGLLPYGVTGGLINTYKSKVIYAKGKKFDELTVQDALKLELVTKRDEVGYAWKTFILGKGYTIHKDKTYLLKDGVGAFYKFRFLDFHTTDGKKGRITMQYERL